jgi:hypothetical protein
MREASQNGVESKIRAKMKNLPENTKNALS